MNEQQGQNPGEPADTPILRRSAPQDESLGDEAVSVEVEPMIVHEARPERVMTARGSAAVGATISGILAAVFWSSYAVTAGVFCSGLPRADCPSSWVPYAVVSIIGFVVVTLLGAFAGWAFFRLYQLMRVD